MHTLFDLRLRQYTPGGAAGGILTALTIDANPLDSDMSTLSFKVSDKVLATLPDFLEVGVEYWDGSVWVESRNGRFLANTQTVDKTDPAGVRSVSGVNLWLWLFGKTSLKGVVPYSETGKSAGRDPGISGATSAGSTVTKTAHGFIDGDAIVCTQKPAKMTTLAAKVVYFVDSVTSSTFKIRGSRDGGAKVLGTWTGLNFRRATETIQSAGTLFRNNDLVTFTNVSTSPTLKTDTSYRVVQQDALGFKVSTEVGCDPVDIVESVTSTITGLALYRELDGDRQLAGTPGVILKTIIDEAKARGWGAALTYDFTTTVDSAGVAWGTSQALQFSPGTSGKAVLDRLVEMGACEYSTDGRTLRVWNTATHGTDRSTGATPVRVGVAASAVPVKMNLDNLITDLTVQGEGNLLLDLHSASAPADLGRLEQFQSLNGVLDSATATLLGQNTLKIGSTINRQYTVTESAAAATALPGIDYQAGDWVQARVGDAWVSLRVAELVMSKDSSGVVTVSLVLNSRFIELLARLARRRAAETGGVSVGGNGTTSPGKDKRLPKAPTGLAVQSLAGWNANGAAFTTISGTWAVVNQATDSTAIDVALYEMWVRADGDAVSILAASGKGTSLSNGPYQPNTTHYVKVRAKSSAGIYGPFTSEVELTTTLPIEPLDPPTEPTVTSKLGTVKVAWDGLLVNTDMVTYTPPPEFEYVWVGMSTTEAGAYTPVGQNLGLAGGATVTGLSLGDVRWFKFYAIDRLGVASPASVAVSVTVVGIKGPDLEANSVTANSIAAGAIQAQHLTVGTKSPAGSPINRVPAPMTDVAYWSLVKSGTIPASVFNPLGALNWSTTTVTTAGTQLSTVTTTQRNTTITALNPAPVSGNLYITATGLSASGTLLVIRSWPNANATGANTDQIMNGSGLVELPPNNLSYQCYLTVFVGVVGTLISDLRIFEVIGDNATGQQSAVISPAGLRLTSDDGSGVVDLTTNSDNFFSINKWTGVGYESQASIDSTGAIVGNSITANDDFYSHGSAVVGGFADALINGGSPTDLALFDRIQRGVVASADLGVDIGVELALQANVNTHQALGIGQMQLEANRLFRINLDWSAASRWNAGTSASGHLYLQVWIGSSPQSVAAPNGTKLEWILLDQASANGVYLRSGNMISPPVALPSGVVYLLVKLYVASSRSYDVYARSAASATSGPRVLIEDWGPNIAYADMGSIKSRVASGTPATSATASTLISAAAWSRSWNNNGGSIVSGTGQYTDANMLYQGLGASAMGSMFGWNSLGLSGKTISKVEIYLRNRSTYTGGAVTVRFGSSTAGYTVPATQSTANPWTQSWGKGVGAWVTVPSALYANIGNGTIKSFALGISSASSEYAYFDGVGKADPPRIRVTYK